MTAFRVGIGLAALLLLVGFLALLPFGLIYGTFGNDDATIGVTVGLLTFVATIATRIGERRRQLLQQFEHLANHIEQIRETRERLEDRPSSDTTNAVKLKVGSAPLRCEVCARGRPEVRRRLWQESLETYLLAERLRLVPAVSGDTSLANLAASGDRHADALHLGAHHKRSGPTRTRHRCGCGADGRTVPSTALLKTLASPLTAPQGDP